MAPLYVFSLLAVFFCAENAHAVCHHGWTFHEGSCYAYVNVDMPWSAAQAFCQSFDARLAEPNTESENNFLKHLSESRTAQGVWIGGTDAIQEGTWQWASTKGLIYPYADWADGEPNSSGGKENCMNLWRPKGFGWNDARCQSDFPFICEYRLETLRPNSETEIRLNGLEGESDSSNSPRYNVPSRRPL